MRLTPFLGLLLVVASAVAQEQFGYPGGFQYPDQFQQYFRTGIPQPSFEGKVENPEDRLFFTRVTVTVATTTSTSTLTVSTTCTTSTATIKACSPSGRRRRGMTLTGDKKGRGLFYNEAEEGLIDGIFFPPVKKIEEPAKDEVVDRVPRESSPVLLPFVVQPGYQAPPEARSGRFLVALGTTTLTTVTTSTYTAILTAACKSTTNYLACSGSGK